MYWSFSPLSEEDRKPAIDIYNHYVENSFAAYPEKMLPYEAFDMFLRMSEGYPRAAVKDKEGNLIGFGMLRPYHPMSTFSHTAEASYFISPDHTGKEIGKNLLAHLEEEGRKMGVTNLLVNISSLNPVSISFHRKNGFRECGRLRGVCRKNGRDIDVIWMQKMI
jgi:L-amino acid N-acyltransferase YncA